VNPLLESLETPEQYHASRAHVFPSIESLRWFVRQNKEELRVAGALLIIAGRTKILPGIFDETVLKIGRRRAAQP